MVHAANWRLSGAIRRRPTILAGRSMVIVVVVEPVKRSAHVIGVCLRNPVGHAVGRA